MSPYVYVGLASTIRQAIDRSAIFSHVSSILCSHCGISLRQLLSRRRHYNLMMCRQMIVAILRDDYKFSYKLIGLYMQRDHSTIINRYRRHTDDYETTAGYSLNYDKIKDKIT